MSARIPATIVTGFLGAGKTTLIRHLVEATQDRRLALVINEFGDVGVDGEILRACSDEACAEPHIVELANGCLCCTVAEDFVPAIEALLALDAPPEHILIETSGLALPKPLVKAFDWPQIRSRLFVDGVVAVVDGPAVAEGRFADDLEALARERAEDASLDHDNPLEEVFEDQIACADIVVLNKTDLLDAEEEARVLEILRSGAGRPSILRARRGAVDPRVALGLGATIQADLAHRPTRHDAEEDHNHDDFESFVVDLAPASDPDSLVAHLSQVAAAHEVLRMKGFVEVAGKPMRLLVQGVGVRFQHHYDRAWKTGEARASRLVVIGRKGLDRVGIAQRLSGS